MRLGVKFAAVSVLSALMLTAGCGTHLSASVWTPPMKLQVQSVPAMPSIYDASNQSANFSVHEHRPWTIDGTTLTGHLRRRFWIPVNSRPKIVYVMPHALALLVTQPVPQELLLNTISGRVHKLWRLPHSIGLYPASIGGFGGHTFFWQTTAGVQGPVATYGGYNMKTRRRIHIPLAALEGSWFEDLTHGALYSLRGNRLRQWQHGRWVSQGELPSDPVEVVSQQGWVMTATPIHTGQLTVHWYNVKSGQGSSITVRGNLEASGADWVIVQRGPRLILAVPSTGAQKVAARHVINPLIANDAVYWIGPQGQVKRLSVLSRVVSAVPDIVWP